MKNVCIVDKNKSIRFLSKTYFGKKHDKTIFLNEKVAQLLPPDIKKLFDTGFGGLDKDCPLMSLLQNKANNC